MNDDNLLPFSLPAVCRKKVSVAFDGGLLSSDGGVLTLRDVERRLGVAERSADCLVDRRDAKRIDHEMVEMLRWRMLLIAAGYEDADDCDSLGADPVSKMAVGRLPESGAALCSQPTMSRLESQGRRKRSAASRGRSTRHWSRRRAGIADTQAPQESVARRGRQPNRCEVVLHFAGQYEPSCHYGQIDRCPSFLEGLHFFAYALADFLLHWLAYGLAPW
jgi:hypothetical protein